MFKKQQFGIDPGSDLIKIYNVRKNTLLKEKNMIAVMDKDTYLAIGNDAYEMYEKNPKNVRVMIPMSEGMIADTGSLEIILYSLLRKASPHLSKSPELYFAVPTDMTQIEKRAYYMLTRNGAFQDCRVFLINRPIADAIALGISVKNTKGEMIVNIGAQSTEISVIADSRVILSRVLPVGGFTIDTEIVDSVRRYHQLFIGMRTAARLKLAMGNIEEEKREARKAMGISSVTGLPKEGTVVSEVVNKAVLSVIDRIGEDIRSVLERTPPQVRSEIHKNGFYLLGGTSSLPGIDRHLAETLEYPVLLSRFTDEGTIHGLQEIIASKDLTRQWAYPADGKKKKKKV